MKSVEEKMKWSLLKISFRSIERYEPVLLLRPLLARNPRPVRIIIVGSLLVGCQLAQRQWRHN
jgi:hypothetical protein